MSPGLVELVQGKGSASGQVVKLSQFSLARVACQGRVRDDGVLKEPKPGFLLLLLIEVLIEWPDKADNGLAIGHRISQGGGQVGVIHPSGNLGGRTLLGVAARREHVVKGPAELAVQLVVSPIGGIAEVREARRRLRRK